MSIPIYYSSTSFERPPLGQAKCGLSKRWSLLKENLAWDICAFFPSKAGLTKEVVFHEGGLSKEVLRFVLH